MQRYLKAGLKKKKKPKYKVVDSVRIWKERGTFHRGYMEDFTREHFEIIHVLKDPPIPRYKLKEFNGEDIVGSFFEDELVQFNASEYYDTQVLKKRKPTKMEWNILYIM